MFDHFEPMAADPILSVVTAYRADQRPEKMDLGIGIYRDESGATPIMAAVREAEARLIESETTKAYVSPIGDEVFNGKLVDQIFGQDHPERSRVRAIQTPGGSGALRMLADLVRSARPEAKMWLSEPTWPNHKLIFGSAGFEMIDYPYFDPATRSVSFGAMMEHLSQAAKGDVVLLHGCCHNPSGADLTQSQWEEIADLLVDRNLLPFIDIAYQGLGDGMEEDAAGLRLLAERVPEMLVATSCSKNFGLYRDRAGAALLLASSSKQADVTRQHLVRAVRGCYSMPPDHPGRIVITILQDEGLNRIWIDELDAMRARITSLRQKTAEALRQRSNSDRFDFLAEHRGLFSLTGLTPEQVARLAQDHAIYLIGDGRMNVASLRESKVEVFAEAVMAVTT
ncbi:MAG: amino acid aminotransferase [Pseudomonadota bacterium]